MNKTWFECRISYFTDNAKVTETYLIDALTYTEAEARLYDKVENDFKIDIIKKSNINEVHASGSGDFWYKCKIVYLSIDEKSGKEKKENEYILLNAKDFNSALDILSPIVNKTSLDVTINAVTETSILEVYPYFVEGEVVPEGLIALV